MCFFIFLDSSFAYSQSMISCSKLFALRKQVGAPSRKSKNTLSELEKVQAVVDLKVNDVQGRWGVTAVKQHLANKGVLMPRCALFSF